MAGLCRKYLVRPSAMLWPPCLAAVALIRSIHEPIYESNVADNSDDIKLRDSIAGSDSSVNSSERAILGLGERKDASDRKPISRAKFLWVAMTAMACYQFLPSYVAPALGAVSLLCYIAPGSQTAKVLGSANSGVGLLSFT
jgi:hypothetical protein